jgi:hypothetical protein
MRFCLTCPLQKLNCIRNIQMEYYHPIIDLNVTPKYKIKIQLGSL